MKRSGASFRIKSNEPANLLQKPGEKELEYKLNKPQDHSQS